jgi:hypothetical protein
VGYKTKTTKAKYENILNDYDTVLLDNDEQAEILGDKTICSYYHFKIIKIDKNKNKLIIYVSLNHAKKYKFPMNAKSLNFNLLSPSSLFKANGTVELVNGAGAPRVGIYDHYSRVH